MPQPPAIFLCVRPGHTDDAHRTAQRRADRANCIVGRHHHSQNVSNIPLLDTEHRAEFLAQQATPLFVSLTKPAAEQADGLAIYRRDNLWVTTRPVPRTFDAPAGSSVRLDLSWNPPE
jgi:hypothetical protein